MHEFSPHFKTPLSIFSMRSWSRLLPCSTLVLSKDKLLTSVKGFSFLINRRIRHGMSSGVQEGFDQRGRGSQGHTSLLVHLSGQFSTFLLSAPGKGLPTRPPSVSHALSEQRGMQRGNSAPVGEPEARREERNQSRVAWVLTRAMGPKIFLARATTGMSISQAIPQSKG